MTRSEEELAVGTRSQESGRVRLPKHVVTENVTKTVPVKREEVRLEREPVTDANAGDATDGPAISDEEHEVVLHEEEVVTEKRTVPKERVKLGKETATDEQQVSEEVRKEQIGRRQTARTRTSGRRRGVQLPMGRARSGGPFRSLGRADARVTGRGGSQSSRRSVSSSPRSWASIAQKTPALIRQRIAAPRPLAAQTAANAKPSSAANCRRLI